MESMGRTVAVDSEEIKGKLATAGFVDIDEEEVFLPINPWTGNEEDRELGRWFFHVFMQSVEPLSLRVFANQLGRTREQIQAMIAAVKRDLTRVSYKNYCTM